MHNIGNLNVTIKQVGDNNLCDKWQWLIQEALSAASFTFT